MLRCLSARAGGGPQESPLRDSSNLDFVRAIAVIAVLLDHVLETLGVLHGFDPRPFAWYSGRMGVLIFFVLTCLVLLQSLERSARAGRSSALGFFVRRAFRIYPLALVCVVLVVSLHAPPTSWEDTFVAPGPGRMLSNLALTMNLTYTQPVLSVLWSLPYELQMYLFLPFVFWCVDSENAIRSAVLLWVLGMAAALVQPELIGRLGVAQFAPCFLAGAISHALARGRRPHLPFAVLPVAMALGMGGYCAIAFLSGVVHPRWLGWLLCLGLGALLPFVIEMQSPWLRRQSHRIAKYSYGIYLFHVLALWLGLNVLRASPPWLQAAVTLVLLVGLPYLGHHLIEKPGIDAGTRVANRLRARLAEARAARSAA